MFTFSKDACSQVADFGLSRGVDDSDYYISHGGKIPVKWTAPEVKLVSSRSFRRLLAFHNAFYILSLNSLTCPIIFD